jgi:ABC-type sugar transport system permease subunit
MRASRLIPQYALLVTLLVILGLLLVYPIGLTLRGAFYENPTEASGFTLSNIRRGIASRASRSSTRWCWCR